MAELSRKPLMSISEVHKDLRKCGVRWAETTIRKMILDGQFPGITSSKRFYVPTKKYEEYKRDNGFTYIDATEPEAPADDKYTQAVMEFEKSMSMV